jgi:ribosomal protein S1
VSNTENEIDFAEAFKESLKEIRSGSVIKGTVAGISNGNIIIDLGFKSDGIMPFGEYSDESSVILKMK